MMLKCTLYLAFLWSIIIPHFAIALTFSTNGFVPERLKNATEADLKAAIKLVDDALEESARRNVARLEHVRRNRYELAPNTKLGRRVADDVDEDGVPRLLVVTPDLAAAAALVAEAEQAEAKLGDKTVTESPLHKRDGFWMESISRKGTSPWGDDPDYKIFRNVQDYGAKGDNSTDDTAAIQRAIKDGKRCGAGCNGSTTKNAIIYFPPGTYIVSRSIDLYFGTQMIGDANRLPVIKATSRFLGLGVFSTDKYTGDGLGADGKDNEWYINTANFYRQIRNFKIDVTATRAASHVCGLHYQVAQATSLQNIEFIADSKKSQRGIFAENGSGGVMSDLTFTGGEYGIYGGSQQFTANRLKFSGCKTAVQIIWDWGWLWKTVTVNDCDTGFHFVPEKKSEESASKENGNIGSAAFMESKFTNVKKAIVIQKPSEKPGTGTTGLVLNRVEFSGVDKAVSDTDGNTILDEESVSSWVLGPVYQGTTRTWSKGSDSDIAVLVPALEGDDVGYLERAKPQYAEKSSGDFFHLKDYAKGDGSSDDTAGVQKAFDEAGSSGKILFADAGVYLLKKTVTIPPGAKIVGETWTQFAATGSFFGDANEPRAVIRVGEHAGVEGDVELQDLLITSKGPTPGAIMLQWNLKGESKGGAALWDCHVRLGGATGTDLTPKECPPLTNGEVKEECIVASMLMHITPGSSGYFDNLWLWVADHMIDDPDWANNKNDMEQLSVYSARGLLVESKEGVWLYGTSSEHSVMYQYNFFEAEYVFAGLLQTESPYFQPSPAAPVPFHNNLNVFSGDPKYVNCEKSGGRAPGCDSSWGLILTKNHYVYIAAAGIYSWFYKYTQDCIDEHECQSSLIQINENYEQVRIEQLITIGATNSWTTKTDGVFSTDNLAIETHPSWSQISLVNATTTTAPDDNDDDGDPDWEPCGENTYKTLDELEQAIGKIPNHCIIPFALQILFKQLNDALDEYESILADDYDKNFGYYEDFINDIIEPRLDDFVWDEDGEGNKYFDCTLTIPRGSSEGETKMCPWRRTEISNFPRYTIEYNLRDGEKDDFFDALENKVGILESWVKFGREEKLDETCPVGGPANDGCQDQHHKWTNLPQKSDNITVPNPKDVIDKAHGGFRTLYATLAGNALQIMMGDWDGAPSDALDVLIMPVSLAQEAVENMKTVAKVGKDWHKKEKERFILDIIGIILLVLPFAGEVIGEIGAIGAYLGRIISLAEGVVTAGLAFYDIVESPTDAPWLVLGALLSQKAPLGRSGPSMGKLAGKKAVFNKDQVEALGKRFAENQALVDKILKTIVGRVCRRR